MWDKLLAFGKTCSERGIWRDTVKTGIAGAEEDRTKRLIEKRQKRKARTDLARLPT